jgi:CRISPR/Cas system-associated exonuclease Cas4 (RecB family)
MGSGIYISASLLKDYLECPKKVFYRINYPEASIETPEMSAGNIVHSMAELYWNDKVSGLSYCQAKINEKKLPAKNSDKVMLCADNFYTNFSSLLSEEDLIEYRFKLSFGNAFLVGRMDRVRTSTGGFIIDWKSSSSTLKNIARDVQFILYQYVYERIFEKSPTSVLRVCLEDNEVLTYTRNKILEYNLINNIVPMVIKSIEIGELSPVGIFSGKCGRCPHSITCYKDLGLK